MKQQFMPVNPRPFLQDMYVDCLPPPLPFHDAPTPTPRDRLYFLPERTSSTDTYHHRVNKDIFVRLKWGETEYKGRL